MFGSLDSIGVSSMLASRNHDRRTVLACATWRTLYWVALLVETRNNELRTGVCVRLVCGPLGYARTTARAYATRRDSLRARIVYTCMCPTKTRAAHNASFRGDKLWAFLTWSATIGFNIRRHIHPNITTAAFRRPDPHALCARLISRADARCIPFIHASHSTLPTHNRAL